MNLEQWQKNQAPRCGTKACEFLSHHAYIVKVSLNIFIIDAVYII